MNRNIVATISIILFSVFILSCSEEFLNEKPLHQIDLENFYTQPIDAEIGLTGAYSRIISKGMMQNLFFFSISADEITNGTATQTGIGSGENRELATSALWGMGQGYNEPMVGIANINLLLKKITDIPDDKFASGRKDEIMGEAHFLRGWAFYIFAMGYRDVQMQLEVPTSSLPEDNFLEKSPQEEILAQAMFDLSKADSLLPVRLGNDKSEHDVRGRASKWAAKAFKARIHMWNSEWDKAYAECKAIVESNQFNMAERWINIFAGENNDPEVIWQAQGQSREEYDFIGVYRWYCDANAGQALPPYMVEKNLTNAFEVPYKDVRLEYSVRAIGRSGTPSNYGGRNVKHFKVPSGEVIQGVSDESRDKNTPLMRLAEVKLMMAEAIIQSNYSLGTKEEVLAILNELRARAADPEFRPREEDSRYDYDANKGCEGIELLTVDDINLQAVKDEKYRELAFEFIRWFDLLRWSRMEDNYESVMALVNASSVDRLYLPIPQSQIEANKGILKQNPGY
ncbi:MAG: RagB/SusD family nutrient uptake outer membrane protein [Prolixibacteraceae bacterium]|nr:RagB/SusD family nutrient uptake outer membrane protein [Prolixibacteraceae bacterium]